MFYCLFLLFELNEKMKLKYLKIYFTRVPNVERYSDVFCL